MSESSGYDPVRRVPLDPFAPLDQPRRRPIAVVGPRLTFWVCTDSICQAVVHYVHPRTHGCKVAHGDGDCPFCRNGTPKKKTWWLQVCVEEGTQGQPELLALTLNALKSEPHLLGSNGYLWGRRLTVWRHPHGPQQPMYAELDVSVSPRDLPRVEPTLAILIRLWQATTSEAVQARSRRGGDGKSLGGEGEERGGRHGA
jgi:hypothetical protein